MSVISNVNIEKFFENENDDIKQNFVGVYSSNSITKFINYYEIMKEKDGMYPFTIFNTDGSNKPRIHWWSFLNICQKNRTFFI